MNPFSPLIVLTLVVFSLVSSVGLASDAENCSPQEIVKLKEQKKSLDSQIQDIEDKGRDKTQSDLNDLRRLRKEVVSLSTEIETCNKQDSDNREDCKRNREKYNELTKQLKYPDVISANKCLSADENDNTGLTMTMIATLGNFYDEIPKPGCDKYSKDNESNAKELKKDIGNYQKDMNKVDKKLAEIQKELAERQAEISKKAQEIRERAEDNGEDLVKQAEEKQNKIQNEIMGLNAEKFKAEQELNSIPENIEATLTNYQIEGEVLDLTDNASINIFCLNKRKKAAKAQGKAAKNATQGTARKAELQNIHDGCLKRLKNSRNNIISGYEKIASSARNKLDNINILLQKKTEELTKVSSEFEKLLGKVNSRAQQALSANSQEFIQAQSNAEEEAKVLKQEKATNQKMLLGTLNSRTSLRNSNAREILSTYDEMVEIYNNNSQCREFKGIVSPQNALDKAKARAEEDEEDGGQQ